MAGAVVPRDGRDGRGQADENQNWQNLLHVHWFLAGERSWVILTECI
jgi:hypothetical protein